MTIGLTGGIASGKTVVSENFRELGAYVIDADTLVHDGMRAGGELAHAVTVRFGDGLLRPDGSVDRDRLAEIVFADEEARHALEAMVHPWVRDEAHRRFEFEGKDASIAMFDAALLVEAGDWKDFDRLLVVHCNSETQLRRLMARDGSSREAAKARIDAQLPTRRKLDLADYILYTEGTLEDTRMRTQALWQEMLEDAAALEKKRDPHRVIPRKRED